MTKIKTYSIKNPVIASDKWIGSDGNTGETKNFSAEGVAEYIKGTLNPIDGGVLLVTEIDINTLDTDIATTVNSMSPPYNVSAYELVHVVVEGRVYILKVVDVTIGIGGVTLTNDDFIILPVNTGANGLNADMTRTSTNSISISPSGTKTLTYTASNNLGWVIGTRLRFAHDSNTFMEGSVTAVSSTSVSIDVENKAGSGTYSSWTISIAGLIGSNGLNGSDGLNGTNGRNADMTRTSTDSLVIASSGSKTLTYSSSSNLGWLVGTRLRFSKDTNNYMEGVITSVSSTSVTITVDNSVGSGTYATWNIAVTGDKGSVGVYPDLVAELFSDEIYEYTGGANTIVGSVASGVTFSLYFKKVGNNVFITGFITNGSGSTIGSSTVLLTITNDAYKLKVGTGHDFVASRTSDLTTTIVNASIMDTSGNIRCSIGSLASGNSLTLRGRYTVNTP